MITIIVLLDSTVLVSFGQGAHSTSTHSPPQQVGIYGSELFLSTGPPWGFELYDSANQTTRGVILSYIVANPGVYLRELAGDLDLAMGVVQYLVWALTRDGEVEDCRTGRFRRFFGAGVYAETERKVISLLKQGTPGRILVALLKGGTPTHAGLAKVLGISSQALTWQIGRLKALGMVETISPQGNYSAVYGLPEGVSKAVSSQLVLGLDDFRRSWMVA